MPSVQKMTLKQRFIASIYSNILLGIVFTTLSGTAIYSQAQNQAFDELPLNGLASFVQLRKEYYIGGLYLETLSQDTGSAISISGRKRMEIHISIDKWSPRRFAQQWNQSILINNDQESLEEFADQILAFTSIAKDNLITGDRIVINMDPNDGTSVYLNSQRMMTVSDNAFFDILMNTWIGQRPPSSDFRNDILTLPTDSAGTELLIRYDSISPAESREQTVAAWVKAEQASNKPKAAVAVAAAPVSAAVPPPSFDTTVTAKRTTPTAEPKTKPKPVKQPAVEQPKLAAPKTSVTLDQPKLATTELATTKIEQPKPELAPAPTPSPPQLTKDVVDATPKAQSPEDQEKLLKIYRSNALKLTYLNTRYPKRAMDFQQEGLVVLTVTLDRQGKVLNVIESSSTKHKLLNKAAIQAVKKTSPYPEVPKGLKGEKIEVDLPFKFQL